MSDGIDDGLWGVESANGRSAEVTDARAGRGGPLGSLHRRWGHFISNT